MKKKKEVKVTKKEVVEQEKAVKADTVPAYSIREAGNLMAQGYKVVRIESAVKGIRPKTWVLTKEEK